MSKNRAVRVLIGYYGFKVVSGVVEKNTHLVFCAGIVLVAVKKNKKSSNLLFYLPDDIVPINSSVSPSGDAITINASPFTHFAGDILSSLKF